ncbi:adaptin N terminal region-domain-containing protein [Schizophyllum amplum]|uniref:AP-3 complex subunit delta n=1 Tax=Schizophyllum amplum TaxID=97359 RepID=A0A550CA89_9AGAR|nr:adaptin N terminal region-domain-containing protein [Auriculariopsis ampla]
MWERTLQDLIRGLRANKKDESKFINKAVDEIKREIREEDMVLKAGAVLKLTYLDMLGYDMSWASFHVVEVMSSPRFHLKAVGYLAATQSFNQDTDVLMLTTNLLKKDLTSTPADVAVTLNGVSHIATPELSRDLSPELTAMLTHSRPQIRKRAVLTMYKVLQQYPPAAQAALPRLKDRLEDPDSGVVAATVNVLCELARQRPADYLNLAPQLFHLLTTSSNNWMLIKIIKLFGCLMPHEPRLVKKLQPQIVDLISTTPAISLLYECVHTCIIGGMLRGHAGDNLARTCVTKLAAFIQDPDHNLKYIALLAMVKIVPTHPHLVAEYQDTILQSVDDQDISIRMRALDLVSAMANETNLQSIVQQILSHLVPESVTASQPTAAQSLAQISTAPGVRPPSPPQPSAAYRLNVYENVSNFEWYLSVLVDLANVAGVKIGAQVCEQLVDVVGRVRAVRRYAEGSCPEVLWAAAWICGEYCSEMTDPQKLIPYLLQPEIVILPADIMALYIQTALKIFGYWAAELASNWDNDDLPDVQAMVETVITAANTLQLFQFIRADLSSFQPKSESAFAFAADESAASFGASAPAPHFPKSLYLIRPLFTEYELNPVAPEAQEMVPVPEGLDLDAWIVPPPPEPKEEAPTKKVKKASKKGKEKAVTNGREKKGRAINGDALVPLEVETETPEERAERERLKAERLERLKDDPYYIMDKSSPKPPAPDDLDSIPVVQLEGMPSLLPSKSPRRAFMQSADPRLDTPDPSLPSLRHDRERRLLPPYPLWWTASGRCRMQTPVSGGLYTESPRLSPYPEYEVPEEEASGPSTPQPIKVTRTKKKGTGTKKKKKDTQA